MNKLKIAALTGAAVLGGGLLVGQASAMPAAGPTVAATQAGAGVQDVRWVCGPYRCWWRPGPYWGPYWGPHRYWQRWGYRRHWR